MLRMRLNEVPRQSFGCAAIAALHQRFDAEDDCFRPEAGSGVLALELVQQRLRLVRLALGRCPGGRGLELRGVLGTDAAGVGSARSPVPNRASSTAPTPVVPSTKPAPSHLRIAR
jgi:hypothetical protein